MESSTKFPDFDLQAVRADFPVLAREKYGRPLVYFDNAASTQKPQCVIDRIARFYSYGYSNIHRGLHFLSEEATADYEAARSTVADFLGAASPDEIVFTRNATESINLVASTFLADHVPTGSSIVLTVMEHHANIVPWQLAAEKLGLKVRPVKITPSGEVDREDFRKALDENAGMVVFCHVSNSLGTINPAKEMASEAKAKGLPVLIDGAQAAPHIPVNVQDLDCDFYAFSGHKVFGPTGIGVLYGKAERLASLPPYQGGGDMIERVSFEGTTFAPPPARFEAGTPHIAGAIGLAEAIRYCKKLGYAAMEAQEQALLAKATAGLREISGVRIVGEAPNKVGVASFVVDGVHPHDLATFLDRDGVAVRAGHHCTMPLLEFLGLTATTRASFAFYNDLQEVDVFLESLQKTIDLLR
ncbi:aminotransferase class V-fold PLP-dependent enzyme [Puniceicoccus vermicola]|uniref:Cysteine desulfurase n=1 Tax=Puniceicoccus vermicola TaxID=388746 RepID=A0A7X1E7X9_9BACT|nr:cysteine desulfurase [Puniceicoccus vermicola]MBC2604207.1 cysteine desulfurase [Puniceicoccus vermicola]